MVDIDVAIAGVRRILRSAGPFYFTQHNTETLKAVADYAEEHFKAGVLAEHERRNAPATSPNRGDAFAEMQAAGVVTTITMTKPDLAAFDLPNARNALRELTLLHEMYRAVIAADLFEGFGDERFQHIPERGAARAALDKSLRAYETRGDATTLAASVEELPELPAGWTWGHDEDGYCAMGTLGRHVFVKDGELCGTTASPIAVVLAVIARNAKGAE